MKEVEDALAKDTDVDESKIKHQMAHYDTLIKEFCSLLNDIDTGVFDIPTGKKLKADKEALDVENPKLKSKHLLFIHFLAHIEQLKKNLAGDEEKIAGHKKEIEELKKNVADLSNDKAELQSYYNNIRWTRTSKRSE
jgi:hypothetical protein